MRDNLRCLVCGSNRFATFRNGPAYSQQQIFYDNTTPSKGNNESSKKTVFNSDYDLLKANEQFKKLLDEGEEDETPKGKFFHLTMIRRALILFEMFS